MTSPSAVHFARGTSYFIIQTVVTTVAMALSFAILARLITTSEMGVFAVLSLVAALCQVIVSPFVTQATTKYIAENIERGDLEAAASVFYQSVRVSLVGAAVLGLVVFLGAGELSAWLLGNSNQSFLFQVVAVDSVLAAGIIPTLTSGLLGLQKFKEQAMVGTASTLVRQAFIIILVLLLQSLAGLVLAWVIGDLFGLTLYSVYAVKALGPPRFKFPLRKFLSYSWPLSVSSLVSFASSWFDRALLLLFLPLATLGIYNATIIAFTAMVGISTAFSNTIFSAYSSMQTTRHKETLEQAVYLASRYLTLVVAPLALGLMATAKPALTLFVGQAYVGGTVPLMVLAGVYAVTLIGTAVESTFLGAGRNTRSFRHLNYHNCNQPIHRVRIGAD